MKLRLRCLKTSALLLMLLAAKIAHAGPAVRVGDSSEHGGTVTDDGFNPVLTSSLERKVRINGKFPAYAGAMHACPLFIGIVPHVGGPVTGPPLSSKTRVLGVPIVLHGAFATCAGAVDKILGGSPNVRINQ